MILTKSEKAALLGGRHLPMVGSHEYPSSQTVLGPLEILASVFWESSAEVALGDIGR